MKETKKEETFKVVGWSNKPVKDPAGIELGIKEGRDCYWLTKNGNGDIKTIKLTNWLAKVEVVIIRNEDERDRKITIKQGDYTTTAFMSSEVLTNVSRFRAFLLNSCDFICLFDGNENDLQKLVEFWGKQVEPVVVRETESVGEIREGFIAENVFVGHNGEIKEMENGYLKLSEKKSIKLADFHTKAGVRAGTPVYPLNEPFGGIDKYKEKIFDLMIKNRNLKVAIAIGWIKSTLWSGLFFKEHRWFPLFMLHGRTQGGKSVFSDWLMSMIGLRDVTPIGLRHGLYAAGLERAFAYYSSLPVLLNDYKNEKDEGQQFHAFFRNVFDRASVLKGVKTEQFKVRQMAVRGCLLLNGETSPTDRGLLSRMITFEITEAERVEKYYHELTKLEPEFSHIGFDWVKHIHRDYPLFLAKYKEIEKLFKEKMVPRQAQSWAVAVASVLTEPYFKEQEDKLLGYAVRLAGHEIKEQQTEETINKLWEALSVLKRSKEVGDQIVRFDDMKSEIQIHLPCLLGEISSDARTRKYVFPNSREIGKLLKQEKYYLEYDTRRVGYDTSKRWCLDYQSPTLPEILKNMFENLATKETKNDDI